MTAIFKRFLTKERIPVTVAPQIQKRVVGQDTFSSGSILLEEQLFGNFYAQDQIIVDMRAYVVGNIVTTHGIINGRVLGNITCIEEVIINETAVIEGSISAKNARIEPGAVIKGTLNLNSKLHISLLSEKLKLMNKMEQIPTRNAEQHVSLPEVKETILAADDMIAASSAGISSIQRGETQSAAPLLEKETTREEQETKEEEVEKVTVETVGEAIKDTEEKKISVNGTQDIKKQQTTAKQEINKPVPTPKEAVKQKTTNDASIDHHNAGGWW